MKYGSPLSKDLREKYGKKSMTPRTGDSVKILRGEYKDIEGKVTGVSPEEGTLNVEGVTREKVKGGSSPVPIRSSNVVITSLVLDDKLRKQGMEVAS